MVLVLFLLLALLVFGAGVFFKALEIAVIVAILLVILGLFSSGNRNGYYHKKRARRNSTATCMCKIYKKVGNSKDKWKYRDLKHLRYDYGR